MYGRRIDNNNYIVYGKRNKCNRRKNYGWRIEYGRRIVMIVTKCMVGV